MAGNGCGVARNSNAMIQRTGTAIVSLMISGLLLTTGCSARRGEPIVGPLAISEPAIARGQQVFMRECHQCHPGGEAGLGPAINNKPLPGFLIKFQVRNGLGAMPAFSQNEISPEELDHLVDYLKALRNHSGNQQS
jgi:mono/diheme cytochrome c family protein